MRKVIRESDKSKGTIRRPSPEEEALPKDFSGVIKTSPFLVSEVRVQHKKRRAVAFPSVTKYHFEDGLWYPNRPEGGRVLSSSSGPTAGLVYSVSYNFEHETGKDALDNSIWEPGIGDLNVETLLKGSGEKIKGLSKLKSAIESTRDLLKKYKNLDDEEKLLSLSRS